jgi:hypothetical protein
MTTAITSLPDEGHQDGRPLRTALFLVGMIGLTFYFAFSRDRSSPAGVIEDAYALALIWVGAFPLWQFLVSRQRSTPFFALVCVMYVVYFGLPRFSPQSLFAMNIGGIDVGADWEPPPSAVGPALKTALLGVSALVVAYHLSGRVVQTVPRMTRAIDLQRAMPYLLTVSVVATLIELIASRLVVPLSLRQVHLHIQILGGASLGGILLGYLRKQASPWTMAVFLGLTGLNVVAGILTGALAEAGWLVAGLLLIYGWERRRFPLALMLASYLIFLPFNAAKFEFRARYGLGGERIASQTVAERAMGFVTSVEHVLERQTVSDMMAASRDRVNALGTLATVVYQTPTYVPYWDGDTYANLAWHFIPRFLVPDKPKEDYGQLFPRRYGLIGYGSNEMSYNFPYLVEFYANFGNFGVVIGMAIVALIYRSLEHVFAADIAGVVVITPLFARLFNVESNFTLTFCGIPQVLLVLFLLVWLLPQVGSSPSALLSNTQRG